MEPLISPPAESGFVTRYFEDLEVGETHDVGSYEVTEGEILSFAEQYDPQPFHTDPEAARESMYGGLIASGWHTAAMFMRLFADGFLSETAAMGSPGIDDLRWRAPVRPGDTLSARIEVVDTEAGHPERGTADIDMAAVNQDGEEVLTMTGRIFFGRRDAE